MSRYGSTLRAMPLAALFVAVQACAPGDVPEASGMEGDDFAALQRRGQEAMGVDQYTSSHLFDELADGGRIELQRDEDDPAGVATIRQHLQDIARAFQAGDFDTPAFVHAREVPGTAVMAAKRHLITYTYRELPRGGEVRITTNDAEAIQAIHEFMAFQRDDHRAGGASHDHGGGHDPSGAHDPAGMRDTSGTHDPAGMRDPSGGDHPPDHGGGAQGGGAMRDASGMDHGVMRGGGAMRSGGMDPSRGMGMGGMQGLAGMGMAGMRARMHGGDDAFAADMDLVHELLAGHELIERTVTALADGVRAVTESSDPAVAAYIKEHVASMQERLEQGEVFNVASPTIPVIFANAEHIRTVIEVTERGVAFSQTTDVPELVPVLQAHADEVSELVRDGMAAMMRSMMQRPAGPSGR